MVESISFGAAITDVTESHWANDVVQNVVDKNVMSIYTDNSFKPTQTATKAEVIVVLYKSALAEALLTESEGEALGTKYKETLSNLGILETLEPYGQVVYPAIGYALENEILVTDEVKFFVSEGAFTSASKVDTSVFFGKALNLYKNENLDQVISLAYTDNYEISLSALKYVNLLVDYNIVSEKGDSEGKFNPKTKMNRAVLSVFTDGYLNALEAGISDIEPTIPDAAEEADSSETNLSDAVDKTLVTGTITDIFSDLEFIEVKESTGKTSTYNVDESRFYSGGIPINFSSLVSNVEVTLTFEEGLVTRVEIPQILDKVEGVYGTLSDYIGEPEAFRSLQIQLENKAFDYKRIYDNDIQVVIDGDISTIDELKSGYPITVYYDGFNAKTIIAYSENYQFKGVLQSDIDINAPGILSVTLLEGTHFEQVLTDDVVFTEKSENFEKNDIVEVTMVYGVVTQIEFIGEDKTLSGRLSEILIKSSPEVTVYTGSETAYTYALSDSAVITSESGETDLDIYDLRLNQLATVHVGIDGIDQIWLGAKSETTGINVTVTQIIASSNLLVVLNENEEELTIAFSNAASLDIRDYQIGDKLYIEGIQINDRLYEAETITEKKY